MELIRDWIVALDLSERSHGAIRFAKWLRERSGTEERLRGVHVASTSETRQAHAASSFPMERVTQLAQGSVDAQGATAEFQAVEVIVGSSPEDELSRLAEKQNVDGLIVGRAASIEGWSLVSLGRVTRRLLRSAPRPLVVVPPDLEAKSLGKGPIVVGIEPLDYSARTVRWGRTMARSLDVPLLLVHVVPSPAWAATMAAADPALAYGSVMIQQQKAHSEGPAPIEAWAEEHGLADLPLRVEEGRVGPALLEVAKRESASLVVCGSRGLSLAERIFLSSTGSELAAKAECPVVVVPPAEQEPS